jgi:hypothetical protein
MSVTKINKTIATVCLELIRSGRLQFHDRIGWLRHCGNSIASHLRRMKRGRMRGIPLSWQDQRKFLGFASA